jgi:hypothetical protein
MRPWAALRDAMSSISGPGDAVSASAATEKRSNVEISGI